MPKHRTASQHFGSSGAGTLHTQDSQQRQRLLDTPLPRLFSVSDRISPATTLLQSMVVDRDRSFIIHPLDVHPVETEKVSVDEQEMVRCPQGGP